MAAIVRMPEVLANVNEPADFPLSGDNRFTQE